MVSFPNGKINLGLYVTGKRQDGFHDIETVFYPVAIHDAVEVIGAKEFSFSATGNVVDGPMQNNLCTKAYQLLQKDFPSLPPVSIHLHKNIPIGAGLGGGSADAVACLQLINRIANLNITTEQISVYALQLGSDCPFFLLNKPCIATGRGELFTRINPDLSGYDIVIVNPGIHVSTAWAFSALGSYSETSGLEKIETLPVHEWKGKIHNDFERVVFGKYPEIGSLKNLLYEKDAIFALMSGTGSSVYGVFEKNKRPDLQLPPSCFVKWL